MKKITAILLSLLLLTTSITGCSTAQLQYTANVATISAEADVLRMKYDNVRTLIINKKDVFPEEQYKELLMIDATMQMLIAKIGDITDPATLRTFSLNDIVYMWFLAKDGYLKSYNIVEENWDQLMPSEQMILISFKNSAEKTDSMISELLSNPNNEDINKSIVMISGMATIALKILPLILI